MRIHRSAHPRAYTVVSNAVLQDHQLSFVARGVLAYLLSLRDGSQVDVRTLAKLCKTGRGQVAGALNELKARGYYAVERVQDAVSGQWATRTVVREDPRADPAKSPRDVRGARAARDTAAGAGQDVREGRAERDGEAAPRAPEEPPPAFSAEDLQLTPAAGKPDAGDTGRTPEGGSTGREVPPSPGRRKAERGGGGLPESAVADGEPLCCGGPAPLPYPGGVPLAREDAALVRRLGQVDERLRIGEAEAGPLVPLIAQWRERGVGDGALVRVLTAGLPPDVIAPVRFVAARLARKLPPQDVRGPVRVRPPECADCARPLPAGTEGRCRACEGPTVDGAHPWAAIARSGRSRVRAALAGARAGAGAGAGAAAGPGRPGGPPPPGGQAGGPGWGGVARAAGSGGP